MSDTPKQERPLIETEFRTIIEDARSRHAAVVGLLYANDSQAVALLRTYVTLGIATASGTAAGLGQSAIISKPVAWALAGATLMVLTGAAFCLRALRSTAINLPGRKADFWEWVIRDNISHAQAAQSYLENLKAKGGMNDATNKYAATALKWAKRCGAAAPLVAILCGAAAHFWL